ncbi:copper resistance protein [Escherichia coli]|nr:copper resistance protein [Escherichia coli]
MSIKNDGHYFCRAGGNRPDGLNEPVTDICLAHPLHVRQQVTD